MRVRDEMSSKISNDEFFFSREDVSVFFSFMKFFVRTGVDRSHATAPRLLVAEDKTKSAIISFCAYELVLPLSIEGSSARLEELSSQHAFSFLKVYQPFCQLSGI